MKVLLVVPTALPYVGGLETLVLALARTLAGRGAEPVVVCARGQHTPGRAVVEGVTVHRLLGWREPPTGRWGRAVMRSLLASIPDVARFMAALRLLAPDVVHVHFIGENAAAPLLASRLMQVPVLLTAHGSDVFRFAPAWARYRVMASVLIRYADSVTTASRALRSAVTAVVLTAERKTLVIPNGVDETFLTASWGERRGPLTPYILSTSRLEPMKGHDVLIGAFASLAPRHPRLRLVIVGDGSCAASLRTLAAGSGVLERVVFAGRAGQAEIAGWLGGCEAFVLPSHSEGSPMSLHEAMAVGAPCIATAVGGVPEMIASGRTGLLVPPRDQAALAAAIEWVLTSADLRNRLGAGGRAFAERHRLAAIAEQYLRLYQELVWRSKG